MFSQSDWQRACQSELVNIKMNRGSGTKGRGIEQEMDELEKYLVF